MTIRGVVEAARSGCAGLLAFLVLVGSFGANATVRAQDAGPQPEQVAESAAPERASQPSFEARWSEARSLLLGARFPEAAGRLRLLVAEEPLRLEPWLDLLRALALDDQSLAAYGVASRVEMLAAGRPEVVIVDATIALRAGDSAGALRRLRAARARDATHPVLGLVERAVTHGVDPLHLLQLPRAEAAAWLVALDEASARRTTGHVLGVLGAFTGVGALVSVLLGLFQSIGCSFGGGCTSEPAIPLGALAGVLGASAIGLVVGAGAQHHEAAALRSAPAAQLEERRRPAP